MRYPDAHREPIVEQIAGRDVADPYRWLEDPDAPPTRTWSEAQDALWHAWSGEQPGREALTDELLALTPGMRGLPVVVGERTFSTERLPGEDHAAICVEDAAGTRRLVDPNVLDPAGTTTLDGWSPSLEGDRLAYLLSSGGDEESRLWVLDVDSGELLDGPIDRMRYSPLAWLPGGEELLYVRRLPPAAVPAGEEAFHRRLWRHRVGTDAEREDVLVFGGDGAGPDVDPTAYLDVTLSPDGAWAAVSVALGTAPRNDLWVARLAGPEATSWQPALVGVDARAGARLDRRGALWLLTDLHAPRGRLMRATPESPGAAQWVEVVGEDPDGGVLEDFVLAGDELVVQRSRHGLAELSVHRRADGVLRTSVPLGEPSSASLAGRRDEAAQAWVGVQSYAAPFTVHELDLGSGRLGPGRRPPGAEAIPTLHSRVEVFRSADGTEVRMTVVAGDPGDPVEPRPTVLYGYGGFDVSLTPAYAPTVAAWVRSGGVWAVANLRGGSEEGEAWHRDGMRQHKHHVFEDFEAAADHLVEAGWTEPGRLGIFGGSNGGLLVGAALTRSPERYRAVVCSAPLLDMVRYERFGLGRTWNDEYGSAEIPEELDWLLSYSPYHHVRRGAAYPATLFTVFDADSRVDPLHARKMAAALQWATAADPTSHPILLRREAEVGHGARSARRQAALGADELSFLARFTGLELIPARPAA